MRYLSPISPSAALFNKLKVLGFLSKRGHRLAPAKLWMLVMIYSTMFSKGSA
jgi:hypothetical protein